ncbi:hypothetical protein PR202_ga13847 [Eleusine coracana subsp. coracana]|uniref:Uncharacterized protein n=1 Tax=Eleusine coracana subsp. coracana TaxID=191504 RepID=A0AAV5CFC7_ELECO|nr:hypothetical protein PR202_ga13847 [Eleusine coracana subsp. coracana]
MVESSFLKCIRSFKWVASIMDEDLHNATDLFFDFENVRSLLGSVAPYAVPQVSSYSLRKDIGFKTEVSHSDALVVLKSWITSQVPFNTRLSPSTYCLLFSCSIQVFRVFVRWANDLNLETDNMNDILYLKESLHKSETTILPTSVDKWVSLHPSFGLVCWVDDDELKQQFEGSGGVHFIQFGDLSSEDKRMLHGRVAALMKNLGIPAFSKVIYREAIFYGTADNREKVALICWLLPYMQRYIYKMHRDTYMNFQKNEAVKLSTLQVVVVDKLFYKYVLRGLDSSSKRRFECQCLLQVSIYRSILPVLPAHQHSKGH